MRMATIVAAALVVTAAGCYQPDTSADASRYAPTLPYNPVIRYDAYSPTIDVKTTPGEKAQPPYSTEIIGLYATINRKSGVTVTYMQWTEVYTDRSWHFYSRAVTDEGKPLSLREVDLRVTRCSYATCVYSETYNVMLPQADLKRAADGDGIKLKIFAKSGNDRPVWLPAFTIKPFMEKVVEAQQYQASKR